MKVTGFSFVKNAILYDYPIVEAITSILPLCDEVVIAVGKSDDDTLELVKSIDSQKIRIVETEWDEKLREGGRVLATETMKAYNEIALDTVWAIYIQGDEVIPESEYDNIKNAMLKWKDDKDVEGLLFNYKHFYGSYNYIADSRKWYQHEVRIVRKDEAIYSYRDAQGFRKKDRPLNVAVANATVHHYGWVKHPEKQQAKQKTFNKLWHSDSWVKNKIGQDETYDYSHIESLQLFTGTHPKVMEKRIASADWKFKFNLSKKHISFKNRCLQWIEKLMGKKLFVYKNYKIIRK